MIRALLPDLDNTLLRNGMDTFLPRYFGAVTETVSNRIVPEDFLYALRQSTETMRGNTDPGRTNAAVFWDLFLTLVDVKRWLTSRTESAERCIYD